MTKSNRWTVALVSAGLVSLPAVAQAEEKPSPVLTAFSATTISGYVDTSAHWNLGTGNANLPAYTGNLQPGGVKADGFNLDVVALTISKPPGEEAWSAGYNATLLFGPEAYAYNTSFLGANQAALTDFSLKDTYVDLHAPLGNGVDLKLGTFTSPLGYEVYETGNNPNYTRSYAYMIEPSAFTGLMGSYQISSALALNLGIVNTWSAGVNSRAFDTSPAKAESFKTYVGSVTFTCPTNCGFLAGSTITGGIASGWDAFNLVDKTSFYVGGTINTPIIGLRLGASYDYVILGPNNLGAGWMPGTPGAAEQSGYQNAVGVYATWQATRKLSFSTRGEYFSQSGYLADAAQAIGVGMPSSAVEVTETLQYDLWKNVVSRLEFRWDHAADASARYSNGVDNAYLLAVNLVYKF